MKDNRTMLEFSQEELIVIKEELIFRRGFYLFEKERIAGAQEHADLISSIIKKVAEHLPEEKYKFPFKI